VDEKNPEGKQLIQKQAMVLSAIRWRPATKGKNAHAAHGTNEELYQEFLKEFEASLQLSEEEKAEEKGDAQWEELKVTLAAAEAKKEAPKAAPKKATKAPKAAKKEAPASPVLKKAAAKPASPVLKKAKKDPFLTEEHNDGQAHIWEWKAGHRYARNYAGYLWDLEEDEEGEESVGDFAGKYDFESDTIDDSMEEPKA
jgi:hypothetical protein